ncbi:MAG: Potassium efflux system KefA protein / Small-conductance mechanosensitive channel [uncultured Gemmatimonadetes bacterium]|uniref:Potassium efflux system KefA protein / Small-conductance mechanosensitive channel n=1 Tax=uncultured Gemmatimonadota bacterium TaxID=203437 RepID=A0A6J4LYK3_9BACT|nr:MAG: Potassium efflux system KefA protein / Small-conductance mechanosensitive channel [uncultured Gemmatimonadota bacterium]
MLQTDTVAALLPRARREWGDLFNWPELTATGLRVFGALVVAAIAYYALEAVLRRVERTAEKDGIITVQEQRTRTLVSLLRSVGTVVIGVVTLFMVLGALGLQLGPLLAGAGVVGLAVSFGAQSLVKDVISGLFILLENQFGVGDVVRLEGVSGSVERMTLRVVVLRDVHGVVHIVPNGEIKKVSNLTRGWARVVLDVGVAYKEDPDRVMEVMRDEGRKLWEDPQWRPLMLEEAQVPGIESFGESGVNVRMWLKVLPLKQWDVAREVRRRLKYRFDAEGIEIPFPHQTVYWGEGQSPAEIAALAGARAQTTGEKGAVNAEG